MKRVPPSERLKEEITELLRGKMGDDATPTESPMAGFVRQVARYMLQVSLEDEATAFLGRDHYRRGVRARAGWRNGYEPKRVQSEAGVLESRCRRCERRQSRSGRCPFWWKKKEGDWHWSRYGPIRLAG